ncbi:anthranilate synthase family protein [Streptomyces sp. G-G2]|uniref:anthranilate synthase family protein n=1 Tax=Streptomyces sp. G-G2 TaxID=3046201 RepID=UPI0024B9426D|nr:anthranilate synthase family protein [Streptomyces sp. G-G2]MDJ0383343.1 anthranilate synthase family protein [Streptomyces sp. G-G2]
MNDRPAIDSPANDRPLNPLDRLLDGSGPPFALLRRRTPGLDHDTVEVLIGPVHEAERLADLPVGDLPTLALVPFRQIRERGFDVRDDGTPLSVLVAEEAYALPLDEALAALPDHEVRVEGGGFDVPDERYAATVERVIEDEIGRGEGANFVIRRTYEGRIPGYGRADALALFRRLLVAERGAYWTYVVHTGGPTGRTLVGASPEVHVRMSGGTVVMNPISGTYRYPAEGPTAESLLAFLGDRKETEELSMVVDEELKMMCTVADRGGVVVGPRLKEMSHLAHTEYELRGRSTLDAREVLRETMFAATVTGSPVQNACRVIERYESGGRGYYAGALALLGRAADGTQSLDSPILIRTADISPDGTLRVPVGATLVRHSDPAGEVAETHAKAAGVLAALGVRPAAPRPAAGPVRLGDDPRVTAALADRRRDLAPFWLRMQERAAEADGHALVIDAEDTFTAMLAHVLRVCGLEVTVRRYDDPGLRAAALAWAGPVVLGPGPGNPQDAADPRMRTLRALARELLAGHRGGILGVCLGHELLAAELGLPLVRKAEPAQGAQTGVDVFGTREVVGFYNTYTARCDDPAAARLAAAGVEVARDPRTYEVHALRSADGPASGSAGAFAGVQFHPESVLTLRGADLVRELLAGVRGIRPPVPVGGAGTTGRASRS